MWTVTAPNNNANNFIIATKDCDKLTYPAATSSGQSCLRCRAMLGVAIKKVQGQGSPTAGRNARHADLSDPVASTGKGCKNPTWMKQVLKPIPGGTSVMSF